MAFCRATLAAVRKLKDTTTKSYIWQPGVVAGVPHSIVGQPYTDMPDMPSEGAGEFPIAFGDWRRAYVNADRVNMAILRDPFTQATNGNIRFIAHRRVGGQVVLAEAIRLHGIVDRGRRIDGIDPTGTGGARPVQRGA